MQLGWLILCQMDLAKGCSGGQQNAISGCARESVSRTDEHWNQSLSKEGSSPQYGWASFNWLRTQIEQSQRKCRFSVFNSPEYSSSSALGHWRSWFS